MRVDLADFLEWRFEEESTAVADGTDKGNDEGRAIVSAGAVGGSNVDIFRRLAGSPVNGIGKVENVDRKRKTHDRKE